MKLINNSVDAENLLTSISQADLEDDMASCNIAKMNGEQTKEESSPAIVKKVTKITNFSNGIHKQSENPSKCNGSLNGYFDDVSDDDYQLVLESSSDDGSSPTKKIDDDTISAPQIVQEIEDLLGINGSDVAIEDLEKELTNMDSAESVSLNDKDEDNSANGELSNNVVPREIQDVFEEQIDTSDHLENMSKTEVNKEEINHEISQSNKMTECDSSSNMNLVFDEVEIGTDCSEANGSNLDAISSGKELVGSSSNPITLDDINDCKVESTTESQILDESEKLEVNEIVDSRNHKESKKTHDDNEEKNEMNTNCVEENEITPTDNEEDILLTQTSSLSEGSVEWTVIDSVGPSDDEKSPEEKIPAREERSESPIRISKEIVVEKQKPADKECSEPQVSISKERVENMLVGKSEGAIGTCSTLCSEGEGTRKRAASVDEELTETKKPKIEDKVEDLCESPSQVLKRPYSENIECETKRTKLDDIRPVPKLVPFSKLVEDNKVSEGSVEEESVKEDKNTEELQTDIIGERNTEENCVSSVQETCKEIEKNDLEVINKENSLENLTSEKEVITPQTTDATDIKSNEDEKEANENVSEVCDLEVSENSKKQTIETNVMSTDCTQSSEVDSTPEELTLTSDASETALEKTSSNEVSTSGKFIKEPSIKNTNHVETVELETKDSKDVVCLDNEPGDEKIESVEVSSSSSNNIDSSIGKVGCKLDFGSNSKEKEEKAVNKEDKKPKLDIASSSIVRVGSESVSINQGKSRPPLLMPESNNLIKKTEPLREGIVGNSKSPFNMLSKHMAEQKVEPRKKSNLDKAIDSVVEKARNEAGKALPLLRKFHKDQLKKLTRTELEETVVLKICEAVTDRSEIGQMRLRCQSLEQNNELWRKKALQFEKQNRELEMVLKRYLSETAQIKRENLNKVALPIKVTRSVGLQVVLASSMHGALVASKSRINTDPLHGESSRMANQQQKRREQQQERQPEREPAKEVVKANTFTPPVQPPTVARGRGRPLKIPSVLGPNLPSSLMASSPQPSTSKVTPPSTPLKTIAPAKTMPSPSKDLEVIDLTDKEERAKTVPQSPISGSIRVSPSTQVCFVQPTTATTPSQPMAYIVQKQGQKQHYLVTTSSSPPRPAGTASIRQPPALALPVFRASGQIIPVQTSSPGPADTTDSKMSSHTSDMQITSNINNPHIVCDMTASQSAADVSNSHIMLDECIKTNPFPLGQQFTSLSGPVAVRVPNNVVTTSPRQVTHVPQAVRVQPRIVAVRKQHPAPLPFVAKAVSKPGFKSPPPEPQLKIAKTVNGIMLSWSMNLTTDLAEMASYQLYAYQESSQPPTTNLWKKVGDVKALPLPMACTLTQFVDGHKYHFAVRAVDVHGRIGPFSLPCTILLTK